MARHLRRKHPHLHHSQDASSVATTTNERLYTGGISNISGPSSMSSFAPSTGYSMLSLRSPFNHGIGPVQRRCEESCNLLDPPRRPTTSYSDIYGRDSIPPSPKAPSPILWHSVSNSRLPGHSYSMPSIQQGESMRPFANLPNNTLKEDPDAHAQSRPPHSFSNSSESMDRAYPARRLLSDHDVHYHRSDWTPTFENHYAGGSADRSLAQAPPVYPIPWHEDEGSHIHNGDQGGLTAPECTSSGAMTPSLGHNRHDYTNMGYTQPAMPTGLPSTATTPSGVAPSAEAELLQSEFFVESMQPRGEDVSWASLDPCMLTVPSAERVRVEAGFEPSHHCADASLTLSGRSASPSGPSAIAADTYFAVNFRGLCDQTATAEPPNPRQVEQIMAELGIDFGPAPGVPGDASQNFFSQGAFAQPDAGVSAAPLIPSQDGMPATWAPERLVPIATNFQHQSLSQAQSSQSTVYLPSLSESQNEYLGLTATSHRRSMDRVMSSASMPFDTKSQIHASHRRTPSLANDFDESLGRSAQVSGEAVEFHKTSANDATANFHKPHESSLLQRAARDEEGGGKSAQIGDSPHPSGTSSSIQHHQDSPSPRAAFESRREGQNSFKDADAEGVSMMPTPAAICAPRQDHGPPSALIDKAGGELDDVPLSENAPQRKSSAYIASSAVSSDQLQLVVERFRVFAQLCQDHMRPSTEMLDCLAPLLPKVIHADAPLFHPKMVGSRKVHSAEEASALLSLASLRCSDPHLKEEGHKLICFLFGLVVLSYKHTLHVDGKHQSLLNCFLLIGMHGVRQTTPDLWHKFEENREAILLDVLKAEKRNADLDTNMDRIDAAKVQDLPEEELFMLWSRWYEHESRKRTLLLSAILDSQSSSYFSPFQMDLSARPVGPRCQFLLAHALEPCPDTVFLAWPPKAWATRLADSVSLPSAKGADIAFHDNRATSIAASLTEQLLRPHVAHVHGTPYHPHFRSSFDFGSGHLGQGSKISSSGYDQTEHARKEASAHYLEVANEPSKSTQGTRQQSKAQEYKQENQEGGPAGQARIVSQLYMSALLEAVHGAWMTDSGWYRAPAWGARALAEQLIIDVDDFDPETATLSDLPGWRRGRTLHATQVAHALMNWSEMFSGWKDGCHTRGDEAAAKLGLKLTDDAHQSTIRWQAIFLGLCAPLRALCFHLDSSSRANSTERERYRRISVLLGIWTDSAYCRRALVHAGTILTLVCAAKKTSSERLGPTSSHAVYMSLVVLATVSKILGEKDAPSKRAPNQAGSLQEELIPTKKVWSTLLKHCREDDMERKESKTTGLGNGRKVEGGSDNSEEWIRVRFWHRKFQYLGLAGIFREHEQEDKQEEYADWRMSVSAAAGVGSSVGSFRGIRSRPRWSSFVGDARWPRARRETIHVHQSTSESHRRPSQTTTTTWPQDPDRDLLRRHLRNTVAGTNPSTETRRWILQGATQNATFCGLPLWSADHMEESRDSSSRGHNDAAKTLSREHLREVVTWVHEDNPAWCFSQEYTSLLLRALRDPSDHRTSDSFSAVTST
nr:Cys(2)His(2) zinc finger transcriptional activator [Melanopsichium pennsylvanicum 4]